MKFKKLITLCFTAVVMLMSSLTALASEPNISSVSQDSVVIITEDGIYQTSDYLIKVTTDKTNSLARASSVVVLKRLDVYDLFTNAYVGQGVLNYAFTPFDKYARVDSTSASSSNTNIWGTGSGVHDNSTYSPTVWASFEFKGSNGTGSAYIWLSPWRWFI